MYQQNPLPEGEALVREEWIDGCKDTNRKAGKGTKETDDDRGGIVPVVRVVSVDPSPTRYCGIIVADVPYLPDRDAFYAEIVEIRRGIMGMRQTIEQIQEIIQLYHPDYLIFEHSAFARWLYEDPMLQVIRRHVRVLGHNTGAHSKGDEKMGVNSLTYEFEKGRVRLPWGDPEARNMSELLFREVREFPAGETDDVLMALWFIKWRYKYLIPVNVFSDTFGFQPEIGEELYDTTGSWEFDSTSNNAFSYIRGPQPRTLGDGKYDLDPWERDNVRVKRDG